jgi:hypothetical protein
MFDKFRLDHFIRDEKNVCMKQIDLKLSKVFLDGWMDGWKSRSEDCLQQ